MTSTIFSKQSAAHWAFGLLVSLTVLSLTELGAWLEYHPEPFGYSSLIALACMGALLWASSLAFAEKPRRKLLENLELALMGASCLLVFPFATTIVIGAIFNVGSVGWTSLWAASAINGALALSLAASLTWGRTNVANAIITSACLLATAIGNELVGSTSLLGFLLSLAAAGCLVVHLGYLAENPDAARFTLWRHPLHARELAPRSSTPAWALVLAAMALTALDLSYVMVLAGPAILMAALYLYDGEDHVKLIALGATMMVLSILLGFEAIGLRTYLVVGLGLTLMLACTECGPALTCCAVGCLLVGQLAPFALDIELGRSLYDPTLITLGIATAACLAALCYSRPDSILLGTFKAKVFDLLFLDDDFEYEESDVI